VVRYDERLTLVQHLEELRNRILIVAVAVLVGVIAAAVFEHQVFWLLLHPLDQSGIPPSARKITTFSPAEPFMISLKVWLYVGVIAATPVLIYEFWAFVGPAFTNTRRRQIVAVTVICTLLYLAGIAFGYELVLTTGLRWLLRFNGSYFQVQNRAADYFSFVAWFLVAFGATFEMPVFIVTAVRLGVVSTKALIKHARWAVLGTAIVSMVATPTQDIPSMVLMWVPLMILYAISIPIGMIFERRRLTPAGETRGGGESPSDGPGPDGATT
jgi:sec-independent protein translocase protein TatC